ncbi:MAG: hypothetical protein LBV78_26045, partial [Kitasatospora sp.]|nr:hypothetical protein [Kitasatospora sp.]
SELSKLPTAPEKVILSVLGNMFGSKHYKSISEIPDDAWWNVHFALAGLLKLVPVMPKGLRPAAYEALAMVPGVKTVPDVRDAKGRVGVAVTYSGRPPGLPKRQRKPGYGSYFIFDPKTYAFLGFRDVRTSDDDSKTYIQLSYLDDWAIVDRVKQRP